MSDYNENLPELAYYYDLANECKEGHNTGSLRYTNRIIIGEGGMKRIEKAFDIHSGRDIALATVLDPENTTAFMHEARLTASLEHPNVIPVYDVGEIEGEPFFTMKLTRGKDLNVYEENNLKKRIMIFKKICEGIAYAHSKEIIHLDLKPQNIQVDHFGEVLICDWGLSQYLGKENVELKKSGELKADVTICGTIKGTPGYMAPEQVLGNKEELTQKTDVFSLGCMLFELLYEQPPFKNENLEDYKKEVLSQDFLHLPEKAVPEALKAVIRKSLTVDPEHRYENAGELADEIDKWLNGFATDAQEAGILTLLTLLVKRHKKVFTVSAVALFLLITSTFIFVNNIIKQKNQTLTESQRRIELAQQAAPEFLRQAKLLYDQYYFDEAFQKVKIAVSLDPNLKEARYFHKLLLTGYLKFSEADKIISDNNEMGNVIDEFKHKPLNPKNFSYLLKVFKSNNVEPLGTLAILSITLGMNLNEKATFVKNVLKSYYSNFKDEHFLFESKTGLLKITYKDFKTPGLLVPLTITKLDLSGTSVSNLKTLKLFKIKSLILRNTSIKTLPKIKNINLELLDLANTGINDLRQLKSLSIKILDLSGIEIKSLKPLTECQNLEKVILSKDLVEMSSQNKKAIRSLNIQWL